MDYLNQISAQTRSVPNPKAAAANAPIFSPKMLKILIGVAVVTVLIIIVGMITGGGDSGATELDNLARVELRMNNLNTEITNYNKFIKSSKVRAIGLSFSSLLANTIRDFEAELDASYEYDEDEISATVTSEEEAHNTELDDTLLEARLNGLLDVAFPRQMSYEIESLLIIYPQASKTTKNEKMISIMNEASKSLTVLHDQFDELFDANK